MGQAPGLPSRINHQSLVIPTIAIALDVTVLGAFIAVKARDDLFTLGVSLTVAALVSLSQVLVARHADHTDQDA